jgi:hypothetical protein
MVPDMASPTSREGLNPLGPEAAGSHSGGHTVRHEAAGAAGIGRSATEGTGRVNLHISLRHPSWLKQPGHESPTLHGMLRRLRFSS